jgi:quercetin dioxygenase-like cupin family protein
MHKEPAMTLYFSRIVLGVTAVLLSLGAGAQTTALTPLQLAPDELTWTRTATGLERANMVGNDQQPGPYVYRARFPVDFRVHPHFHPDDRVVTVISGTLHMGFGEQFDEGRMRALPPGSFWTEPAGQPHYVWAKNGEVVIQVIGHGPTASTPTARATPEPTEPRFAQAPGPGSVRVDGLEPRLGDDARGLR